MTCRRAAGAWACAAFVSLSSASGRAQQAPAGDADVPPPTIDAAESGETIVVDGTAPLEPGTSSGRTVDRDTLALVPARSADDLLRVVPGLFISQHAAEGKAQQFFVRGFDAVHGSDLAVAVAGVPLNEPSNIHGHGYVDLGFVIPEVVRSLVASKGSYALDQGDFATAGSVDLELGVERRERGSRVAYEAGTTNRHRVLGVVAPASLPDASFVAIEAMHDDGFGENRGSQRLGAIAQHRWRRGPHRWIDVVGAGYAARFDEPGVVPLADYEAGRLGFYDTHDPAGAGRSARALLGIGFHAASPTATLDARAYAQWRRLRLAENFTGYLAYPDTGDLREQRHQVGTAGGSAWWRRRLAHRVALELGVDGRADRLTQAEDQLDQRGVAWQRNRWLGATELAAGLAAGVRLGWGPRFTAAAGLRADALWIRADDRLGGDGPTGGALAAVSPRLTAARELAPGWTLFGAYGHGLRSPEARAAAGDPHFTTSRTAELGARGRAGDAVSFGATAFAVGISNELVFDHLAGTLLQRNATRRLGVELQAAYRPRSWLRLRVDATAVDARFVDSGSEVPGAPRLLARGEVQARHPRGWRAGGQVVAMAPRPLAHGAEGAGFAVVDLVAGYLTGRYELGLQLDNALGARWREGEFHFASRFDPDAPLSQIPRLHYAAGRPFGVRASLALWF